MISVSRFIYEIALNLTMIESDPVQTADIPYPPPSHASLTLAPLAINLKCTPVPVPDWPTLPQPSLLLAPINADHSRSDFPARDLDFVPPSALRAGCSALRGRRVHRAGEGHLHNLPWSLDRDGRGVIRPGDTGVILLSWCSVIMNRNTLPFNVWKLLLNTKQETIEIAFFLVWYHAMYCWHLQLLRHITFLNDTKFAPAAKAEGLACQYFTLCTASYSPSDRAHSPLPRLWGEPWCCQGAAPGVVTSHQTLHYSVSTVSRQSLHVWWQHLMPERWWDICCF